MAKESDAGHLRHYKGPLSIKEPFGVFRVPTLHDSAYERDLLHGSYPRTEAPSEPGSASAEGQTREVRAAAEEQDLQGLEKQDQ